MFDLEKAIAGWRSQLSTTGVNSQKILDELETHLREDIELQIRGGLEPQQAFVRSILRLGQASALQLEFEKASARFAGADKARLIFSLILIAVIVWLSLFTFARMGFSPAEWVVASAAVVSCLLVAGLWKRAVHCLPVIHNKRRRYTLETILFISGFVCSNLLCALIFPCFERNLNDKILPAIWLWAVFPIAIFLALACGIEEAARGKLSTTPSATS